MAVLGSSASWAGGESLAVGRLPEEGNDGIPRARLLKESSGSGIYCRYSAAPIPRDLTPGGKHQCYSQSWQNTNTKKHARFMPCGPQLGPHVRATYPLINTLLLADPPRDATQYRARGNPLSRAAAAVRASTAPPQSVLGKTNQGHLALR